MIHSILATKQKMTQSFEGGIRTPITVVTAGPCVVTQVKDMTTDGYTSVQIGFGTRKIKNISKSVIGHLKGALNEKEAPRFLREVRVSDPAEYKVGQVVKLNDIFTPGDTIQVQGTSKGKGFAGGIKRHGFAGGPKTHGQSDRHRAPGSIGQGTDPGRVHKGKRMAGHMGDETVTVKNLKVVSIDPEKNELWINGPVPGSNGGLLIISRLSESKVTITEPQTEAEAEEVVVEESNA